MRFFLKQWYIHKNYKWNFKELEQYEQIFDNFEIITEKDTNDKRVGYLVAYTENAVKVAYIDTNNCVRYKYIPISAVCVIDEKTTTLTQCLFYKKMNERKNREHSNNLVKGFLKYATCWNNGYLLNPSLYQ